MQKPIKRFLEWIGLKEKLHDTTHRAPLVSEGEIWWASIGENIGSEISGKSSLFSRPVIVYKKLAHGFYCVIPTTTKVRSGSWYVKIYLHDKGTNACLHQVRTIDYKRLSSRIGMLDDDNFASVQKGFNGLYK